MKKSTIKRRKRVVPAYPDAPIDEGAPSQHTVSASPEPVDEDIKQAEDGAEAPAAKRQRPPPSIDFTGYDPSSAPSTSEPEHQKVAADYAHQVAEAFRMQERQKRRFELQQEAEAMRVALRAKEKELDDL